MAGPTGPVSGPVTGKPSVISFIVDTPPVVGHTIVGFAIFTDPVTGNQIVTQFSTMTVAQFEAQQAAHDAKQAAADAAAAAAAAGNGNSNNGPPGTNSGHVGPTGFGEPGTPGATYP